MTIGELEKRVKALEDIEEIKQLQINYILALNHQDFKGMIECFAEDATIFPDDATNDFKEKREGKEAIAEFFRAMAKRQRKDKARKGGQILIHPVISVDGDTAKGIWTWYRIIGMPQKFTSESGLEIMLQIPHPGFYTMEYRRVNGKWKFSKFHFTHDWFGTQWPK